MEIIITSEHILRFILIGGAFLLGIIVGYLISNLDK